MHAWLLAQAFEPATHPELPGSTHRSSHFLAPLVTGLQVMFGAILGTKPLSSGNGLIHITHSRPKELS